MHPAPRSSWVPYNVARNAAIGAIPAMRHSSYSAQHCAGQHGLYAGSFQGCAEAHWGTDMKHASRLRSRGLTHRVTNSLHADSTFTGPGFASSSTTIA